MIRATVTAELAGLEGLVMAELRRQAGPALKALRDAVEPGAREAVRRGMEATPEHASLLAGRLRREFGLANAPAAVEDVVRAVEAAVRVEVAPPAGPDSLGGVFVGAFRDDFSDAMAAPLASYTSLNSKGRATLVPWLSWLLFAGDAVAVADYGLFSRAVSGSRTGSTIMVRAGERVRPWGVPHEFAGTERSNWLLRAAEQAAPLVAGLLEAQAKRLIA